jgi:hypothetical protein
VSDARQPKAKQRHCAQNPIRLKRNTRPTRDISDVPPVKFRISGFGDGTLNITVTLASHSKAQSRVSHG